MFLKNINSAELEKRHKLEEVSQIWAKFEYPNEWLSFINYFPVVDGQSSGIDALYCNYLNFIEQQSQQLKQYFLYN